MNIHVLKFPVTLSSGSYYLKYCKNYGHGCDNCTDIGPITQTHVSSALFDLISLLNIFVTELSVIVPPQPQ